VTGAAARRAGENTDLDARLGPRLTGNGKAGQHRAGKGERPLRAKGK
jgi:hypothetical protein